MTRDRRRITTNGEVKRYSHIVWHARTGHWPEWPEVIHHIDNDTTNDDFSNLQLMSDSEHKSLHNRGENNPMYDKPVSEETRAKISAAWTPERRAKLSAANMGENHPFFGKTHTEATKAKISAANMGENNPSWKGDAASDHAKYCRIWRLKRRTGVA